MVKLHNIFKITYGNQFNLNAMSIQEGGVNFIGRTAGNNGKTASVREVPGVAPYPKGSITVALGGSVLSSFLQPAPFYTGQNIAILHPLLPMSDSVKLFYCHAIKANAYRFSTCGREANRFLGSLILPSLKQIPDWVYDVSLNKFAGAQLPLEKTSPPPLKASGWRYFLYQDLFEVKKGRRLTRANMTSGGTRFIGSTDKSNGVTNLIDAVADHCKNLITVNYNGSVAEAFYQAEPFLASDDVNVLYPLFSLDPYIALFLCTLIKKEKYRFSYGRKWHKERMELSKIKLPVDVAGRPDWDFMRNYIKALPYSSTLK